MNIKKEKTKQAIHGLVAIAITPMTKELEIDEDGLRSHLHFLVDNGINKKNGSVVVNGSTGECAAMTLSERKKVAEIAIDAVGDIIPVIIGCNHTDVNQTIELVKHAEDIGAAGVMILSPYYYTPPTDEAVIAFYRKISSESSIGIMFYNNVGITDYDVPVSVMSTLADTTNVIGIKECTPYIPKMEQMVRLVGDRISVLNGQGEFFEPYAALIGTNGFISSTTNFAPKLSVEMWEARSKGDFKKANEVRRKFAPYLDFISREAAKGGEPKAVAIIKKATDLVGSHAGPGRIPILDLSKQDEENTKYVLSQMKLI